MIERIVLRPRDRRRIRIQTVIYTLGSIGWMVLLAFTLFPNLVHAETASSSIAPKPAASSTPVPQAGPGRSAPSTSFPAKASVTRPAKPHRPGKRIHRHHRLVHKAVPARPAWSDPRGQVLAANAAARLQPALSDYVNAIQHYPYSDGALFQVYAAPGQITDLTLQDGEQLVGNGAVAAGDTVRWIIGDTESGSGTSKRVHILVKPTRADIGTNLIINTDRRTYHLELRATPATYMASVSWTYPQDQLIALRAARAEEQRIAPVTAGLDLAALNFRYRIEGDKAAWRPVRVFDDGRQVMVEFADGISTSEMPPVFVIGADGSAELVNYRVQGRYMVVDRLFSAAELRLATKKTQQVIRITREAPAKGKAA